MMLSQRLKELRVQKGWTQGDLAKFSSVSIDDIKGYEMGKPKTSQWKI
ncbi:MAG: helix-turn-helix domain-containing protein [Wolinella sp.]